MTKLLQIGMVLVAAVMTVALAEDQAQQNQQPNQAGGAANANMDQEFVKHASADNMFEIQLGQFIQQHAEDSGVKEFAQMLVQDHQQAQKQLQQAAQQANIQVPQELPQVKQLMLQEIQQKQGRDLETCFVFDQVGDHHKDLLKTRYEAQNGQNPQIKQYAEQTASVLRKHMRQAEELADKYVPGEAQQAGERIRGAAREGLDKAREGLDRTGAGNNSGNTNSGGTSR